MLSDLLGFLSGKPPHMEQVECEAFIDAVVYTMMVDKVIDPNEMEKVEGFADKLPWQGEHGVHDHVRQSITRALKNKNFITQAEPYLQECSARMKNPEARAYTRKACLKVVKADGEQTRTELALVGIADKVFQ
tara:strand:- start:229 stop:627 length:399 start_codon:yes stop_codon:yes gene_type:complete